MLHTKPKINPLSERVFFPPPFFIPHSSFSLTGAGVGSLIYIIRYYKKVANLFDSSNHVTGYYTRSGAGTTESPFIYTDAEGTVADGTTYYEKKDVLGADIRSDVYGGGNNAEVTGDTKVKIGRKEEGE